MRWPSRRTGQHISQVFVSLTVLTLTSFSHVIMALGSFEIRMVKLGFPKQSSCRCDATNLKVTVCLSHHQLPPPRDPVCTLGETVKYGWSPHSPVIQIPFSYTWSGRFTLSVRVSCQCNTTDAARETIVSHMVLAHSLNPSNTWTRISTASQSTGSVTRNSNVDVPLFDRNGFGITAPNQNKHFDTNYRDDQILEETNLDGNEIDFANSNSRLGIIGFDTDSDRIQIPKDGDSVNSVVQIMKSNLKHRESEEHKLSSHDSNLHDPVALTLNVENEEDEKSYVTKEHLNDTFLAHRIGSMAMIVRVTCQEFYHGTGCVLYCKPRNDFVGHFRCTDGGSKVCLSGWKGRSCREAMCQSKCLPSRGHCTKPFQCNCVPGWHGQHCEQCQTSRGCRHGYCHQPVQCLCHKGWTGPNCDKEIDYEMMLCQNGGTRIQGKKCLCTAGFTGIFCEFTLCPDNICLHNGTCLLRHSGPFCLCPSNYGGPLCQRQIDNVIFINSSQGNVSCANSNCDNEHNNLIFNPCKNVTCLNNGSCKFNDFAQRPYCACPAHFTGDHCETFMDPCDNNPCQNGGKCSVELNHTDDTRHNKTLGTNRLLNGTAVTVKCECTRKFSGEMCNIKKRKNQRRDGKKKCGLKCVKNKLPPPVEDICSGSYVCHNGGKCIPSFSGKSFRCQCQGRWTGEFCEIDKTDPCVSQVCLNGGECQVESGVPQCVCPTGFNGYYCEIPVKLCSARTCHYGGICIEHRKQFFCICRRNYFGKFCERTWRSERLNVPITLYITHSRSDACKSFSLSIVILYWPILRLFL